MLCKKKNPKREKNHQVLFLLFIFKISFRPFCARFLSSTCSNLPIDIKRALTTFQGRISETTIAMQLSPISFRAQLNRYELLCAEKIENIDKVQRRSRLEFSPVVRELFFYLIIMRRSTKLSSFINCLVTYSNEKFCDIERQLIIVLAITS